MPNPNGHPQVIAGEVVQDTRADLVLGTLRGVAGGAVDRVVRKAQLADFKTAVRQELDVRETERAISGATQIGIHQALSVASMIGVAENLSRAYPDWEGQFIQIVADRADTISKLAHRGTNRLLPPRCQCRGT